MSEKKINSEDVFKGKLRFAKISITLKVRMIIISFNLLSGEVNIWVYYNKNWNVERGTEILNTLLTQRKLDLLGYLPWQNF